MHSQHNLDRFLYGIEGVLLKGIVHFLNVYIHYIITPKPIVSVLTVTCNLVPQPYHELKHAVTISVHVLIQK